MSTIGFCLQGNGTDLENELLKSKKYFDWRNIGKPEHLKTEIILDYNPDFCPVGSIGFVEKILEKEIKPLIPPPRLRHWLGRECGEFVGEFPMSLKKFNPYVKSMDTLKHPNNGWWNIRYNNEEGRWFWTEDVGVLGEFRIFLGREGKILDIRNYVGYEFWPNITTVRAMAKEVYEYYKRPVSFDVIVSTTGKTLLLEIHDYFALGLYGFSDPARLPFLILDWYRSCLVSE